MLDDLQQDTDFATFTYGFDTPTSAVPRIGTAAFTIDVFGLATTPGYEPRQFQGSGTFSTDFAAGIFSARSYVTETELVSGQETSGGGIELISAGRLSASDGTFSGNFLYGGFNGSIPGQLPVVSTGRPRRNWVPRFPARPATVRRSPDPSPGNEIPARPS